MLELEVIGQLILPPFAALDTHEGCTQNTLLRGTFPLEWSPICAPFCHKVRNAFSLGKNENSWTRTVLQSGVRAFPSQASVNAC